MFEVLPLVSILDAFLLGFPEVTTSFGLPQRLLVLPWELLGYGARPASLSIGALEHIVTALLTYITPCQ